MNTIGRRLGVIVCAFVSALVVLGGKVEPAHADQCESVISGASMDGYDGKFGGYDADGLCHARGGNESSDPDVSIDTEEDCRELTGDRFVRFSGDYGKNFTHCVFKPDPFFGPKPPPVPPIDQPNPPRGVIPAPPPNDRPYNHQDPTGADKSRHWFTLQVCNYSGHGTINIAVDVPNSNSDSTKTVRGWWPLGDGGCRAVLERDFGDSRAMELYVHAHTNDYEWPNKQNTWTKLCIADYSPYQRTDSHPYNCPREEDLLPFARYVVNDDPNDKGNPIHTFYTITFR